jgi:hypothetical protein
LATSNNPFSIDTKQKIYQGIQVPIGQGIGTVPSKLGINTGFNSTKVRTQRFGVTSGNPSTIPAQNNLNPNNLGLSATTSPNYNVVGSYNHFAAGPNTTNNANFQHKQRQLNYSPNM